MQNYTFRLRSGQDLFDSIQEFVNEKQIQAGCVISSVGSLRRAVLRFANNRSFSEIEKFFEIASITGVVSIHGSHLHISISDGDGQTIGGHMESGCRIYTTAEVVLLAFDDLSYRREYADDSGYEELVVYNG